MKVIRQSALLIVLIILMTSMTFASEDVVSIVYKRAVESVGEQVEFIGLDQKSFPSGLYEVDVWQKDTQLVFSSDIKNELVLLSWYLIKQDDKFEVIPMSEAMLSIDHQNDGKGFKKTVMAPSGIEVQDSEGMTYTEESPELYGLMAYYVNTIGQVDQEIPTLKVVKFNDLGTQGAVEEAVDEAPYVLAAELKQLAANDYLPPVQPVTESDFTQVILYMGMNDIFEYTVSLPHARFQKATSSSSKDLINTGYHIALGKYPEYMSYTGRITYTISSAGIGSDLTIRLYDETFTEDEIVLMRKIFALRAQAYINEMKSDGKLSDQMTQWDQAKAIYEWVILNTTYDLDLERVSHTGFGLLDNGTAVCEGYTATYNMMCRLMGIDIQGVVGDAGRTTKEGHIWSLADLDSTRVHIDSTWGDPVGDSLPSDYINYDFFGSSAGYMRPHHVWDETIYGK